MTTNQPPRKKRTILEILTDVENGILTAEQAAIEIENNEEDGS